MSMHMMKIHADTKCKNKKHRNAKSAKASRESKENWEALMKKYNVHPKSKKQPKELLKNKLNIPEGRSTKQFKSIDTGIGTATKPVNPCIYTGDGIIGISVKFM